VSANSGIPALTCHFFAAEDGLVCRQWQLLVERRVLLHRVVVCNGD
jgi:hypothetical protein